MNENHDLDPQLEKELARVREVPARDPNAAARGRARFLAEASVMRPKPVERKRQVFIKRYAWQAALATMVVLVLVFGGGAGAALAAQDDLPNQPLYPVKLITEDVRLNLASGSQAKIDLLLQFVDVRIDEMNQLVVLESDIPVKTTERLENQVQLALELAAGLDDEEEMQAALTRIRTRLEEQTRNLAQGEGEAGETLRQTQLMLQARLRLVSEGMVDHGLFRNQMRYGQGGASTDLSPVSSETPFTGSGTGGPDQTPGYQNSPEKTPEPPGQPGSQQTPGGGGAGHEGGPFSILP
jgi:hypothetical protein